MLNGVASESRLENLDLFPYTKNLGHCGNLIGANHCPFQMDSARLPKKIVSGSADSEILVPLYGHAEKRVPVKRQNSELPVVAMQS